MQQDAISAFRKNLNDLEEIVMQAKRVPLSNMCMVDRERILGLANAITTDLPTVFAECEGVVQNQITIISEANERAEQTKQNATMRANQYVTDAKNQAQQMTAQAQQQAQEMLKKAQQQAAGHGARGTGTGVQYGQGRGEPGPSAGQRAGDHRARQYGGRGAASEHARGDRKAL